MDCEGNGAADNVIAALDWLAGHYELPAVASLSLGSNSINAALDTAMQNVIALGITGVVAAGNYNSGVRSGSEQAGFRAHSQLVSPAHHLAGTCRPFVRLMERIQGCVAPKPLWFLSMPRLCMSCSGTMCADPR